jgi:hypothetical protein
MKTKRSGKGKDRQQADFISLLRESEGDTDRDRHADRWESDLMQLLPYFQNKWIRLKVELLSPPAQN